MGSRYYSSFEPQILTIYARKHHLKLHDTILVEFHSPDWEHLEKRIFDHNLTIHAPTHHKGLEQVKSWPDPARIPRERLGHLRIRQEQKRKSYNEFEQGM